MSTNEDGSVRAGFETIIRESYIDVLEARKLYHQDKYSGGSVAMDTRRQLASSAITYYDVLWEYAQDDPQMKEAWNQSDCTKIEQLDRQSVEVEVEAPGNTSAKQLRSENALVATDPELIIKWTKELDGFRKKMDFAAASAETRPKGRIGSEDKYE